MITARMEDMYNKVLKERNDLRERLSEANKQIESLQAELSTAQAEIEKLKGGYNHLISVAIKDSC